MTPEQNDSATTDHSITGSTDTAVETPANVDNADYQAFLDDYSSQFSSNEGEVLHGHVLTVSDKEVIVDIGRKTEGLVPASQFPWVDGKPAVKAGETIEVMIDRSGNQVEGYILLSYERPHRLHIWEVLEKAVAEGTPVTGKVTNKIKGGLTVDIGVIAFLPSSQVETRPVHNLDSYLGKEIEVKVLKLNKRRGNAVVSRRGLLEQAAESRKAEALANIQEGATVSGTIKNLTDYGAFVDLGGIDGLLHVSDLSYGNVTHPSAVVHVGDQVTLKVLKFDREKERISLGLKQLRPDPWLDIEKRYPPQSKVPGRVVSVTDYGAFVELEPGVEGLIHISEMTWSRRMKHPAKVVKAGDQVEAIILELKPKERRISLGIKQLEADPAAGVLDKIHKGQIVTCVVTAVQANGIEVKVDEVLTGFIRRAELARDKAEQRSERFAVGDTVDAKITSVDRAARKLQLTIKGKEIDEDKSAVAEFGSSDSGASLGDILGAAIRRRNSQTDE